MKQSLQLKLSQSLSMTPQLQQAIRLLQLSTFELQTEIQEALETNPLLQEEVAHEKEDKAEEGTTSPTKEGDDPVTSDTPPVDSSTVELDQTPDAIPDNLPVDSAWEDIYEPNYDMNLSRPEEHSRDFTEFHSAPSGNLRDHLAEQIQLMSLSVDDAEMAESIIDAVDDNGYLTEPTEALLESFNTDRNEDDLYEVEEFEAVLRLIHHLDPLGCGARTPSECMLIQLQHHHRNHTSYDHAHALIEHHIVLLAAHDFAKLKRHLKINDEQLRDAIELIKTLTPRPGAQIAETHTQYVVPDVFVRKEKGAWRVELNPDISPRLSINNTYANLIKRADKSDQNTFLRNNLQEARWFIKSLQSRNETLLRVATAIVERQRSFLDYGDEAMKPMILRDIAEQLDMHESTISRVTTQKYMHTPRGILEFKYFFSSHVTTADGGECSATAIRAIIKKLISAENQQKPLSDNKIAGTLVDMGINVARRTVAKYRESMAIPPSNERKRLL